MTLIMKRVVKISEEAYQTVKNYAKKSGRTISEVTSEIIINNSRYKKTLISFLE
jgi:predicted DNA-binding protein